MTKALAEIFARENAPYLGANHRPVATFLKVVGRKSERMGGEHKSKVSPHTHSVSRKGVRGISPEKIFDLWLPLCAFKMRFGPEFQPGWAALEQAALAYP